MSLDSMQLETCCFNDEILRAARAASRRAMHEHFVSGGNGCEFYEVLAILGILIVSFFHQTLVRSLFRFVPFNCKLLRWTFDVVLFCSPSLIALTLPDQFVNIGVTLISLSVILALMLTFAAYRKATHKRLIHDSVPQCTGKLEQQKQQQQQQHNHHHHHHHYFIPLSYVRALTVTTTLYCILAVDFPIFPRRFAKTETHGFSVMDIGVGLFVCVAAGLSAIKKKQRFRSEMKSAFWMSLLGTLRLAMVTWFDYQAPIMEYGRHLNFFLCFAATRVVCAVFYAAFPESFDFIVGAVLYLAYQLTLQSQSVHFLLHSPERDSFVMANKEGLASIVGSTCLFFVTSAVCRKFVYKLKTCKSEWIYFIVQISILSASCMATALLMHYDTVPVSRRLFNLPYSLWTLSIFLICLIMATLVDTVDDIVQAVNKGAIWIFLLGNLLTGAINKLLDGYISTTKTSVSIPILIGYGTVLLGVALFAFPKPMADVKSTKKD